MVSPSFILLLSSYRIIYYLQCVRHYNRSWRLKEPWETLFPLVAHSLVGTMKQTCLCIKCCNRGVGRKHRIGKWLFLNSKKIRSFSLRLLLFFINSSLLFKWVQKGNYPKKDFCKCSVIWSLLTAPFYCCNSFMIGFQESYTLECIESENDRIFPFSFT